MPLYAMALTTLAEFPIHPQTLLLIGVVVILGVLFMRRARTKRSSSDVDARAGAQARMHNSRLASQAREDIGELMVRLEELSREICGQIDTRFAKLEHAINEADAKLAALRGAPGAAVPSEPAVPTDPRHAEVCRRAADGQIALQIAREMDMPVGEVELILSLQRSRQSLAGPAPSISPAAAGREDDPEPPKGLTLDERA